MIIIFLLASLAAAILANGADNCPDVAIVKQWEQDVVIFQSELIEMGKRLNLRQFEDLKDMPKCDTYVCYLRWMGTKDLLSAWNKHSNKAENKALVKEQRLQWALMLDTMHVSKLSTFALASSACANVTGTPFPVSGKIPCACEQEGRGSVTLSADAPDDSPDGCMPLKCDCGGGVTVGSQHMVYNFYGCLIKY